MNLFFSGIREVIILIILILINIPIIYFTVISLFYKNFHKEESGEKNTREYPEKSTEKIFMTPVNIIKAIILIAFICGIFAAEIILIDKIGITYFDYSFILELLSLGQK